jgi:hypothetical protein
MAQIRWQRTYRLAEVIELVSIVFSGLSALVSEDAEDAGELTWPRPPRPVRNIDFYFQNGPGCTRPVTGFSGPGERPPAGSMCGL